MIRMTLIFLCTFFQLLLEFLQQYFVVIPKSLQRSLQLVTRWERRWTLECQHCSHAVRLTCIANAFFDILWGAIYPSIQSLQIYVVGINFNIFWNMNITFYLKFTWWILKQCWILVLVSFRGPARSFKIGYTDNFQDGLVKFLSFAITLEPVGYAFSVFNSV